MAQTNAQIRAGKKYRQKQEYLQARVSPEEKATVLAHTEITGESLNEFMRRAFKETIERDKSSKAFGNK